MIRTLAKHGIARKIAHDLLSLADPQRGLADVLLQVRQLPGHTGADFLKLLQQELIRLRPYSQDRVETSNGLDDSELMKIANKFSYHLKRKVVLRSVQNKSLIGGICITVGDRRWERSINTCLRTFAS
jgi:hypothetical protein